VPTGTATKSSQKDKIILSVAAIVAKNSGSILSFLLSISHDKITFLAFNKTYRISGITTLLISIIKNNIFFAGNEI
jgi:hypothetical protein